jgi:hypothetical protein
MTSASAPFAAGIFALGIQLLNKNNITPDTATLDSILSSSCDSLNLLNQEQGYGVINPLVFIQNLATHYSISKPKTQNT